MLVLRDHIANDLQSLTQEFDLEPMYAEYQLKDALRPLSEAGLIVEQPPAGPGHALFCGRIEVAPNWLAIQHSLDLSLRKLASMGPDSLLVKPYFGAPMQLKDALDVFVLMSFAPDLRPIYEDHILKVTKALNLIAKRADDFFSAHHIMSDVWEALNAARLIIADCTGRNPNVFYEIGVAHTLGRPVVLITQRGDDVPFDLRAIRYIQFDYTPRGMAEFEQRLESTLREELNIPKS
jgi:hypothetical protein